jgi:hypothetical protein
VRSPWVAWEWQCRGSQWTGDCALNLLKDSKNSTMDQLIRRVDELLIKSALEICNQMASLSRNYSINTIAMLVVVCFYGEMLQ